VSDLQSEQYIRLVEAIGYDLGLRRGWQTEAANRLGVHQSFVSKIAAGKTRNIGARSIDAAVMRGFDKRYFETAYLSPQECVRRQSKWTVTHALQIAAVTPGAWERAALAAARAFIEEMERT
jgi:hypothetical protein